MNTHLDNEWTISPIYPDYELTKSGRLRNKTSKLLLKDTPDNDGYVYNVIQKDNKSIKVSRHRIMAKTFLPNPDNLPTVNHKDLNPLNNSLENLEWMSYSDQVKHSNKTNENKKAPVGKKVIQLKDGQIIAKYESVAEASRQVNISSSCISSCCNGKKLLTGDFSWKYDEDDNEIFKNEIWEKIEESNAFVSSMGRFKSTNNIITFGTKRTSNYYTCNISVNGKRVPRKIHREVAKAFIPNPNNYKVVNHKDGNKSNNCVENLEWVTHSENTNHYIENKVNTVKKILPTTVSAYDKKGVKKIDRLTNEILNTYNSIREASVDSNVRFKSISAVCHGRQEVAGGFKWEFVKDEEIEDEIWKVHESGGEFSNMGRCRLNGEILKGRVSNEGYVRGTINKNLYSYHMEIAKLFVENPTNATRVRYLDGNKLNNEADNLEWIISKR